MDPMSGYSIPAELTEGFRLSLPRTIAWTVSGLVGHAPLPAATGPAAGSWLRHPGW